MPQTLELFHGSPAKSTLSIMRDGCMRPDAMKLVFFSARFEDALQHGADTKLHASFAFRAQVTIVDGAAIQRVSKPGNPLTVLITTALPLPIKILELYVRLGRVGAFELKRIQGAEAIKGYLLKNSV
jgi:hypothetical protein